MSAAPRYHVLSVLVENRRCARTSPTCSPAAATTSTPAVAPTDDENFSRITVVVDVESAPLEQVVKQLNKLINVIKISELDPRDSVERELMMLTVKAPRHAQRDTRARRAVRRERDRRGSRRAHHEPG
ncbi:MAG: acetolactate synthase small subunit [Microthrixaceae bacterium]